MLKGIDVSEHQGRIDWDKAKDHIDFAMLRAGYGRNTLDKQFIRNIRECNRLGIDVGIYWFSYALTVADAHNEAQKCIAAIKDYKIDYPVCFDFEYDSIDYMEKNGVTPTKTLCSAMARAFLEDIEAARYYAMNYTNTGFGLMYFDDALSARFDLWLASWFNYPNFDSPPPCGIWQWGGKAIPGIQGDIVDGNVTYKDYPAIIKGVSKPIEPKPAEPNVYTAACEKLKAKGYDDVIIALADKIGV